MKILIDNGHGASTKGKRSPDERIREYKYCREIAAEVYKRLKANAYDVHLITPEDADTMISTRCKRVNEFCRKYGAKNCVLVSIHLDAAGADGQWHNASGFSARVSLNASSNSKKLATIFTHLAKERKLTGNRCIQDYWQQNLGICRDSNCPAVLTENFFQDNKKDVEYLLSADGRNAIITLHVDAIKEYIKTL